MHLNPGHKTLIKTNHEKKPGNSDALQRQELEKQLALERARRLHAEKRLAEKEMELRSLLSSPEYNRDRLLLATQGINDGMWDWNPKTNEVYLSPRWKEILGYGDSEIPNTIQTWMQRVHENDLPDLHKAIQEHLENQDSELRHELRMRHRNGSFIWILLRARHLQDISGKVCRIGGSITDITEQKNLLEMMDKDAHYDQLTGLPNRLLFSEKLRARIIRLKHDERTGFAVLHINLDHFKHVNDTLGPSTGDDFLMEIALRLENSCRIEDVIGRWAGDEFAIIYDNYKSLPALEAFVERILHRLGDPIKYRGQEIFLNSSVGICISNKEYEHAEDMMRDADLTTGIAKSMGKNRYAIFNHSMLKKTKKEFNIHLNLHKAIDRQELLIYYQPIVNLRTGETAGFEALLRWMLADQGFISPSDFIPLAEESDMILPLGRHVLENAINQGAIWNRTICREKPVFISINVSPRQFDDPELIPLMRHALNTSGLDPSLLKIEITESVIAREPGRVEQTLEAIRNLGVSLSIDDFGTGQSSLSSLHKYPFKTMKVDRSFVTNLEKNDKSQEMLNLIALLAKALKMEVVVEGIETRECCDLIKELQLDYGQGYYFSRAVSPEYAEEFLLGNALVAP